MLPQNCRTPTNNFPTTCVHNFALNNSNNNSKSYLLISSIRLWYCYLISVFFPFSVTCILQFRVQTHFLLYFSCNSCNFFTMYHVRPSTIPILLFRSIFFFSMISVLQWLLANFTSIRRILGSFKCDMYQYFLN